MIIPTLTSNCALYRVNRNRSYYQEQVEKRRAFLLFFAISICLIIAVYFGIIYG